MECSAKKGGEDVSGADGIFSKVVDKVREALSSSQQLLPLAGPTTDTRKPKLHVTDYRLPLFVYQAPAFVGLKLESIETRRRRFAQERNRTAGRLSPRCGWWDCQSR